ncbi:ribonuclease BN [Mycobacterium sp. E2462]|uniref:YihY/virulence factor BrkB family protein n=1 Tax=unclassified Mycobacterium TaxID=2642494 RepID=UPI0007FC8F6C|nr:MULTISPECIES: YhjD/YihY/BrkB family envelope integrity protein [unclassified Mycobacterium]OBG78326.1 ribonuclease BN [Mycobacterium sp. E1214]OBH22859.1 ribonuclease BN [Mycobacterium sp. E1319]OBI17586.1 ribonuclease BN [Mycobacterium sp. E2462]
MVGWLDDLQRRNRAVGVLVAVVYKYNDDQGGYLAVLITYYALVSLFPLLLLLTTGLGVVLAGRPDLQAQVLHSTLSQFPVIGNQLHHPEGLSGGPTGVVIGLLGALYGGLGVGQALQNAMDSVWAVPKHQRPDPLRARLRSGLLLLCLGSAAVAATALSAVGHATGALGAFGKIGLALLAVAINAVICLIAFKVTTARPLTYREVWPGAVAAAFIWQLLQWFGAGYVAHTVRRASATNSVFALVLGALAFLFLASVALVVCAEINVVLVERLYPRALLGAFTDDVDLTPADRRTYTKKVKAERVKAYERVSVTFDDIKRAGEKGIDHLGARLHNMHRPHVP